ncbi:MAG TPA: hypothetical protein DCR94_02725 [Firmicutes bacterium]|nr:hypothetical protein [Bacillota bacterium]
MPYHLATPQGNRYCTSFYDNDKKILFSKEKIYRIKAIYIERHFVIDCIIATIYKINSYRCKLINLNRFIEDV